MKGNATSQSIGGIREVDTQQGTIWLQTPKN